MVGATEICCVAGEPQQGLIAAYVALDVSPVDVELPEQVSGEAPWAHRLPFEAV
jgi:hypothetical protein